MSGKGHHDNTRTAAGQPTHERTGDDHRQLSATRKPCVICGKATAARWLDMPMCGNKKHPRGTSDHKHANAATPGPPRKPGDGPVRIVRARDAI
jgi:hypothetical protein